MPLIRCDWPKNERAIRYHDEEWGVPVWEDQKHFEFLVLESAQAGLSWDTVLRKREYYREAFSGFDPLLVSQYDDNKLEALMQNEGLIRNRQKLSAAIHNARLFLDIQAEFGRFSDFIWDFVGGQPKHNAWQESTQLPSTSPESDALSKALKKRGFKFVGSTTLYSHLQAAGLINDHLSHCYRYAQLAQKEA